MRFLILAAALVASCNDNSQRSQHLMPSKHVDTVVVAYAEPPRHLTITDCDTAYLAELRMLRTRCDSLAWASVELSERNDTLARLLFASNYRVERVRYYAGIVRRNRSQQKFLLGWVTRALE